MDNLVFEEAVNSTIDQSEFISKKWVYVNDNNSQNYTSQVVLDSTPLSNAGGWINWSEGYIVMPLVVQLTSANTASLPVNSTRADWAWAFKSGFWNIINSMNVEFNNQNIIQQTPLTNVFRSFKANTSFSQDDLLNEGSSIGFMPDTASSWSYKTANSSDGRGVCNNRDYAGMIFDVVGTDKDYAYGNNAQEGEQIPSSDFGANFSYNKGMSDRQEWYGYDPVANTDLEQEKIMGVASCRSVYRSFLDRTQSSAGSLVWVVYAKLRLKDLNEYFEKAPLLKGSTIRFYLNTNQCQTIYNITAGSIDGTTGILTPGSIALSSVNVTGGLTNPLMIASNRYGCGSYALPTDTYTLSVSIYKNNFTHTFTSGGGGSYTGGQTSLTAVRLYAPVYQFNPLAQQRYLQLAPTKKIIYRDIFQYQFSGIGAGENFNFLVSNGIPNIKSVLVVPYLSGTANGGLAVSTLLSPFASTPAMPDPIPLTNFNILVSGVNLFLNNQLYDYEQFRHELMSSNQLNGNLTTGLTSGLISEAMFSSGYRYYYGNCSRILPAEAGVSRSVQIIGQNASLVVVSLLVFVEFEKECTIDIATGARID
jgi:hypothetical protein